MRRYGFDFPLEGSRVSQHRSRVGQKRAIGSERAEVGERPADVAGNDIEQRLRRRCEKADIELGIEKERRDIGAVENILQIVGCRALPLQRLLKLTVEGGQLLIQRLQLLFRRQQLFIGRLKFFIDGKASSLIAFCSSPDISRLWIAPSSSVRVASSSFSSSLTRGRLRRPIARPSLLSCIGWSMKQISSSSSPSLEVWLHGDVKGLRITVRGRPDLRTRRCAHSS